MDHEDRALAKLLRAMRCFGLAPYRSLQSSQISRPFEIYSRILFFYYGGMIIWTLVLDLRRRSSEFVTSQAIVMYLFTLLAAACIQSILYLGMFHSKRRLRRTFHYLKRVKKITQSVGCLPAADPTQLQVCLLLVVLQVSLIVLSLTDSWMISRENNDLIKTLFVVFTINGGYLISNKIVVHFVLMVLKISIPFRAINEQLIEIATEMQSNKKHFGSSNFNVPLSKINQTIDVLGKFNIGRTGKRLVHERLRSLACAYVSACGLVQQHSDSEEMLLFFLLVYMMMNLASTGYLVVVYSFLNKDHVLTESNYLSARTIWYLLHIFRGLLLAAPCHKMEDEVGRTRNLICKLMRNVRNIHDPVLAELEVFHIHLTANHPSYTVLGIFTIKRPMILTMMALATTGLAVFL